MALGSVVDCRRTGTLGGHSEIALATLQSVADGRETYMILHSLWLIVERHNTPLSVADGRDIILHCLWLMVERHNTPQSVADVRDMILHCLWLMVET